jgi:uncharacterized protein (TIGR02145 family)
MIKTFDMRLFTLLFAYVIMASLLSGCRDKVDFPDVEIKSVEFITHNSAIVHSEIVSYGTYIDDALEKGLCYNEKGSPTIDDKKLIELYYRNDSKSIFTTTLSQLEPNKKYYLRAYVQCKVPAEYVYSKEFELTTNSVDSMVDERDNQTYRVVKIGTQVWFAENLNFATASGSYPSKYPEKTSGYGRLYTLEAAKTACPRGWHLPTDKEWKILEAELGLNEKELDEFHFRGESAGCKLKEPGSLRWSINSFSTNETGFTALPAHWIIYPNETVDIKVDGHAYFLSSTIDSASNSIILRHLAFHENGIERKFGSQKNAYSVRCVKD